MVTRETSIASGLAALGLLARVEDPDGVLETLQRFGGLLAREAVPRGFLGPNETGRIASRHILESAALAAIIPEIGSQSTVSRSEGPTGSLRAEGHPEGAIGSRASLIDVGSGAGLPGVVLACLLSESRVTLLEQQARRAAFLRRVVAELGLDADVVQSSAEVAGRSSLRESAGAVVARALATPTVSLELTLPLAAIGGVVLLLGGAGVGPVGALCSDPAPRGGHGGRSPEAPPGAERARPTLGVGPAAVAQALGGRAEAPVRFEVPGAERARWVMLVRKIRPTPDRYPRRPGVPRRRPLGGGVAEVK